jgi:hypothetical protein
MRKPKLNRALREALLYLGPDYTTKVIDMELCLYRDLQNGFDIEVSGLRSQAQGGRICNFICVWDTRKFDSVEYVRGDDRSGRLRSLTDLKLELDALVTKYGGANPDTCPQDR